MFKTALALTAAFTLMTAAAPSFAQAGRSVTVIANDLNLAAPGDVAKLKTRIALAAKTVCGPLDTTSPRMMIAFRDCQKAAVEASKPKVDDVVAAYLNGKAVASTAVTVSR
jgi:UrcA family protein